MREAEAKILDYIAENPGATRGEIARSLGLSYWTVRDYTILLYLKGYIERKMPKYEWEHYLKRASRKVVISFKYTAEEIRKLRKKKPTYEPKGRSERLVEIIVEVDKPVFVNIEPEYVLVTLLDHSNWAFSIGTRLAQRKMPGVVYEFPGRYFWKPEPVESKFRRLKIKPLSPEISGVNVGTTDELKSKFKRDEIYIRITYTDYNYPNNSFTRERIFEGLLEFWKRDEMDFQKGLIPADYVGREIRRIVSSWIIDVCNEEFAWWTPKWVKEKYGVEWE